MRRLAANVAVRNPATGMVEVFSPDSEVPTWAGRLIRNPKAWAADEEPSKPARKARARKAPASSPPALADPENGEPDQ